jgi:protein-L-isoaspartate(D-aspartate) O-methyltransferase
MYEDARREMVRRLQTYGYISSERVLQAMSEVPRHEFLPKEQEPFAYRDTPLSIGLEQTISAPHMVAMMLEVLDLRPGMKVLEIGGGSGYHAALMGQLVRPGGRVYTVEIITELAERAREALERTGFQDTVEVVVADGSRGLPEHAPYERITVAAAAPYVPGPLKEQLADGGRLLIPVGGREYQSLELIVRHGSDYVQSPIGDVVFVPLVGVHGQQGYR